MELSRGRAPGSGEGFLGAGDLVCAPVTAQEAAAAEALAAEQLAVLNATDPAEVPGTQAEAAAWADIVATLRTEGLDDGSRWAPEVLQDAMTRAVSALGVAGGLDDDDLARVFDDGLRVALEAAGAARARLEGLTFALAFQASSRGLHTAVGLSLVDWVRVRCPWMSVQDAAALRVVVEAAGRHWGLPLADAVRQGRTSLARAARVARTMLRLSRVLEADRAEAYGAIATGAACDLDLSERELGMVCARLLSDLLEEEPDHHDPDPDDPDDEAAAAGAGAGASGGGGEGAPQALRCLTRVPLGRGMTRYVLDTPAEDAALIDGITSGPLAAPVPGPDGQRDARDAKVRAYDALKTVLSRGLAHPGAAPTTARASVVVTVRADPRTGRPAGAAHTATGQSFKASAAGRFACIGDLTPVVLGEMGEPLDLGRTRRLATPGQFKALLVRDRHCTFPGCTIPGTWCEAHHIIWWCRGGDTDLVFLVLLCPRHHTLVHDKDLTATVHGAVVTWDT